LWLCTAG